MVDLPDPLEPTSATVCPGFMSIVKFFNTLKIEDLQSKIVKIDNLNAIDISFTLIVGLVG